MFEGIMAPQHLILVLLVVLLVFGPKRLPEIGRSLGKGIQEFKGSMNETIAEIDESKEKEAEVKNETPNVI